MCPKHQKFICVPPHPQTLLYIQVLYHYQLYFTPATKSVGSKQSNCGSKGQLLWTKYQMVQVFSLKMASPKSNQQPNNRKKKIILIWLIGMLRTHLTKTTIIVTQLAMRIFCISPTFLSHVQFLYNFVNFHKLFIFSNLNLQYLCPITLCHISCARLNPLQTG